MLATVPYFSNQQGVDVKDVVYKARASLDNVLNVSLPPFHYDLVMPTFAQEAKLGVVVKPGLYLKGVLIHSEM